MCGICGIITSGAGVGIDEVRTSTNAVSHRGPDDEGYVVFTADPTVAPFVAGGASTPDVVYEHDSPYTPRREESDRPTAAPALILGHRRLSIVDLTPAGHQPMCDSDLRHWIVYNGEIYNHPALRVELEDRGHHFQSHSDTEVILAAYEQWGASCLERLDGMFAFLLYDTDTRSLLVARDRFGIKPLYYWISAHGFVAFGSEIKQFALLPGWKPTVNGQRAYDFLAWGALDHTEETLFAGVHQVPPGYMMHRRIDDRTIVPGGRLPTERWYELAPKPWSGGFDAAAEELRVRFLDSVASHLKADVRVGSCLSGGIDSSSIVCAINHLIKASGASKLQQTFSAAADHPSLDESHFAADVVRATGVRANFVTPRLDQLFDVIDALTWHQDEPFGSTSIYAQWRVFELARDHDTPVLLDGQGADEQLAGYHEYLRVGFADMLRHGQLRALFREIESIRQVHGYSRTHEAVRMFDAVLPEAIRQQARRRLGRGSADPSWLNSTRLQANPHDPFSPRPKSIGELSFRQLTSSNLQMLLHWEDRNSMAHSVEARVPFLDHHLVEFVLGLPSDFKLSGGVTKRVFRESIRDLVPASVAARQDKIGFATPEEVWMLSRSPHLFRTRLSRAIERSDGVIRASALELFDGMVSGDRPFSQIPWRIMSFDDWSTRFGIAMN
jgi:asparagine synthase (glutamine-hydrolysing)